MNISGIIKKLVTISLFVFVAAVTGLFVSYAMGGWNIGGSGNMGVAPIDANGSRAGANQAPQSAGATGIAMADLARHNQGNDCWLLIKGRVYDVSNYINQHPGGRGIIINNCGKEVTGVFASIHSNRAWNLLTKYDVGALATVADAATTQAADTTLANIETARASLQQKYPDMNIIDIKPGTKSETVAKVVYKGALVELHLDGSGKVISKETVNDEHNWEAFSEDEDD
jgi:hypothetical protein